MAAIPLIQDLLQDKEIERTTLALNRGDILCQYGAIETHIYFVLSGAVCAFHLNEGVEQVIRFGYQDSIINALPSYFSGEKSAFEIRAIRASNIIRIEKQSLQLFIQSSVSRLIEYQAMLERLHIDQSEREIDLLTNSPTERYNRVFKRSPQLFQEVPAKYIASYLRMTPETLSRIQKS